MRDFIFDMETGDPDDALTLALLAGHPNINLRGVTVTPGTPHQIGVVRWLLKQFDLEHLPVGAFNIDHKKARGTPEEHYVKCVSDWHYRTFGEIEPSDDAYEGWQVLDKLLGPDTTLVTGGPLKNLGKLIDKMALRLYDRSPNLGRLFIQGGFAGDNVVPEADRLPKFEGRITCPTFNLNGDPKAALKVLSSQYFDPDIRMVSKNVCHGVVFDQAMWDRLNDAPDKHPGIEMVLKGMASYLQRHPKGKKFHDPLAAMCALNPDIGEWAQVEPYREKGEWGCKPSTTSGVHIITSYDHELFIETMLGSTE